MVQTLGPDFLENYPEDIFAKYIRDVCNPFNHPSRGCGESERVVSFDFQNLSSTQEPSAITLDGNGDVGIARIQPPAAPVHLSSQGVLARGKPSEFSDFQIMYPLSGRGSRISDVVDKIRRHAPPPKTKTSQADHNSNSQRQRSEARDHSTNPLSSREAREQLLSVGTQGNPIRAEEALTLLTVSRLRCKEGYLFDGNKNKRIVADDERLQSFWDWVGSMLAALSHFTLTWIATC